MSRTDCSSGEMLVPTPDMAMASSHLQQGVEHLLDCGHHTRIRAVGVLEREQVSHFGIDIDTADRAEPRLQGIDDDILRLLQALRGVAGLALRADDLAQKARKRSLERAGGAADAAGRGIA